MGTLRFIAAVVATSFWIFLGRPLVSSHCCCWVAQHRRSHRSRPCTRFPRRTILLAERNNNEALRPTITAKKTVFVLESREFPQVSFELAHRLSLPLLTLNDLQHGDPSTATPEEHDDNNLFWTHAISVVPYMFDNVQDYAIGISLVDPPKKNQRRRTKLSSMKPLYIDFMPVATSPLGRRTQEKGPDLLVQAVAPKPGSTIYDLTAGLGQDSLLLAHAAAPSGRVHMIERDPIVATLLEDALRRLEVLSKQTNDSETQRLATQLSKCLSLECCDAVSKLQALLLQSENDDSSCTMYLDPMFPARKKSASVKKNMQVLHSLLDSQDMHDTADQALLLLLAHQVAKHRVVVKRPIHAPQLLPEEELRCDYKVTGSINRWDVYVKS